MIEECGYVRVELLQKCGPIEACRIGIGVAIQSLNGNSDLVHEGEMPGIGDDLKTSARDILRNSFGVKS